MLNRKSAQPLNAQFEDIVRNKIASEHWQVHLAIPSENELSSIYGISRSTVRMVLNRIVADGLLYRVPGKGTFVAEPKILSRPLSQMGIREQLEHMGYETSTELLTVEENLASSEIAKKMEIIEGAPIYFVKRLRYLRKTPFSIHTSYVPKNLCPGLDKQDLVGRQLCDIEENIYNLEIVKRIETLELVRASASNAKLLDIKRGEPLLLFENLVYSNNELPIECSKVLFKADKIKLRLEYFK